MIEPGSLDPWRDVPSLGARTAGACRAWSLGETRTLQVQLIALALEGDRVVPLQLRAPHAPRRLPLRPLSLAKQTGTRWLQKIGPIDLPGGALGPWLPLDRREVPRSERLWHGTGGAQARLVVTLSPGGVLLECQGHGPGRRGPISAPPSFHPDLAAADAAALDWLSHHTGALQAP